MINNENQISSGSDKNQTTLEEELQDKKQRKKPHSAAMKAS